MPRLNWKQRDVMEALVEKRYKGRELREGNIFLELCVLIERVCSFDTMNFFIFCKAVMKKIGVKPPFTLF